MTQEDETIATYNAFAQEWHEQHKEPNYWDDAMDYFQTLLPKGTILEIGAGGGRDAKDLIKRGYDYYGTEPAANFIPVARQHNPGAVFEQKSVYELEAADYDGFWASAVLLHVPRERIQEALTHLRAAVRSDAVGFIAIKEGEGERVEVGGDDVQITRLFVLWQDNDFRRELAEAGFEVMRYIRTEKSSRTIWLQYFVRAA